MADEIIIDGSERAKINNLIAKNNISPTDWIFFLDFGPYYYRHLNPEFQNINKVFIYGSIPEYEGLSGNERITFKNSWQVLFWHPEINYTEHGSMSNCKFVRNYSKRFAEPPDFHSAYIYSILESAGQIPLTSFNKIDSLSSKTILGEIKWNKNGLRKNASSLFFNYNREGSLRLFTDDKSIQWCENTYRMNEIPIIVGSD